MPDIDIDFADRSILLDKIKHRIAKLDSGKKHNTGVYFTEVPHDPVNNLCTLDYENAEQRGYFKIDCLNVSIYKDINLSSNLKKTILLSPAAASFDQFNNFEVRGTHFKNLIAKKFKGK